MPPATACPTAAPDWWYDDGLLTVASTVHHPLLEGKLGRLVRPTTTPHFRVYAAGGRTVVLHALTPDLVDNDLGALVAAELVGPGLLPGPRAFERGLTGLVRSAGGGTAGLAWETFYANTLRRLSGGPPAPAAPARDGPIATFAAIYRRAGELVVGERVLDVGSCFGFFPLLLGRTRRRPVVGSDRSPGTTALADRIAGRLPGGVRFVCADAAALSHPDGSFDTVTALHLLEHLPAAAGRRVLAELRRVARRRVVVAVPFEERPDPTYGHREAFTPTRLGALGAASGWAYDVVEHHGGWLVLDRP